MTSSGTPQSVGGTLVTAETPSVPQVDPDDVRRATDVPASLVPFNRAGVLGAAEIHGVRTLGRLTGEDRPDALLALALALRAPQHGHVCIELDGVAATVTADDDAPVSVDELEWPEPSAWRDLLATSPLVTVRPPGTSRPDPDRDRPLSLVGTRLYLDRYWRYERRVAEILRKRGARQDDAVDTARVRQLLDRLLPAVEPRPDRQRIAVATGVLRDLTVVAGGPGTGKTYTVARLIALLHELHGDAPLRIAVAAPTGKAADRLATALREAAETIDTAPWVRDRLRAVESSTLHRLLGWRPGTRFAHDRRRRLPHRVVIVDETSMVDLPLMAKLLEALRRDTKLVLVGDPDQLASVEAGAVLADIVGPSGDALRLTAVARERLAAATGEPLDDVPPPGDAGGGIHDSIVVLGTVRRFRETSGIARLAAAIHAGVPDDVVGVLAAGAADVDWIDVPGDAEDGPDFADVRARVVAAGVTVHGAARAGRDEAALAALEDLRILTAHRRGPVGATGWVRLIERWLAAHVDGFDPTAQWYVGRPVIVTRNEPHVSLYNGDVGVVVAADAGVQVAFRGRGGTRRLAPSRLEDIDTVHALTIHKSQGSQFGHVVVVLPDASSPILSRELLYTAVTRATGGVTVLGTEAAVRAAVARRVSRASGLRETLWGHVDTPDV